VPTGSREDWGRRDLPFLAGLLLLALIPFGGVVLGQGVLYERDIELAFVPRAESLVQGVAQGSLPLWDPYPAFGISILGDPSYQVFYPLTWLNLVLRPHSYYGVFAVFHCLLGGAGVYLLARRLDASPPAAFVGAAIALSSGPCLSAVNLWHHYAGASWVPWVLLALDALAERPSLGRAVLLGGVSAAQILAGSMEMCLVSAFAGLSYVVFRVRPQASGSAFGKMGIVAFVYALALSAAQWLPAAVLLQGGSRLGLAPVANMGWSVHPASIADLVVPGLVSGLPLSPAMRDRFFESREPFLSVLYLGAGALVLSGLGVLGKSRAGPWAAFALLFLIASALGSHAPLFPALRRLPLVSLFRYPQKALIPSGQFLGLLTSGGFEAWCGKKEDRRGTRACVALGVLLAGGALVGSWLLTRGSFFQGLLDPRASLEASLRLSRHLLLRTASVSAVSIILILWRVRAEGPGPWLRGAFALLLVGDVALVGARINPTAPVALADIRPPILETVREGARVFVPQDPVGWLNQELVRGPRGWPRQAAFTLGLVEMLFPLNPARFSRYGSFEGDFTNLGPPAVFDYAVRLQMFSAPALKVLQAGAVDYVVALHDDLPGLVKVSELPSVFADPIHVFRVPDPLPRTYVVEGVREAPASDAVALVLDPGFDIRREIVLESGARAPSEAFRGESRVTSRRADAVDLDVEASGPGYVVLVDADGPGWKATVDDRTAPVLTANGLFRAVPVPSGHHRVEMRYRPIGATAGVLLSLLAVFLGLFARQRGRTTAPPPGPPEPR
jgi:hypothetical protein